VKLEPDVILAPICGAPLNALRRATQTIPIVVATCTDDMVASGLVASLARPGGNITGQQKLTPELSAKRLEYLKQVVPGAARVAVLWDPGYSDFAADWRALREAAKELGVTLLPIEANGPDQWEAAFAAMSNARADALITMSGGEHLCLCPAARRPCTLAKRPPYGCMCSTRNTSSPRCGRS
jgi:putative ABC transport system substrate-binding protein